MKSRDIVVIAVVGVALGSVGVFLLSWTSKRPLPADRRASDAAQVQRGVNRTPVVTGEDTYAIEGGVATSEHFMLISSPTKSKP